jgi:hypothetical protein
MFETASSLFCSFDAKHTPQKRAQEPRRAENNDLHARHFLSGDLSPKVYAARVPLVSYPTNPSLRRTFDIVRLAK